MKLRRHIALLRSAALAVLLVALCQAVAVAGPFAPPVSSTLTYRYTRTATSQSPGDYEYGRIAYTIDLEVLSYSRNRVTCSFSIRDLERVGFGVDDADSIAFPGTGTIVLNSNGTIVETTIASYLVQPDMEELNDFLTGAYGDNDLFYRSTFLYFPSFADTDMEPGDTLRAPLTSLHRSSDNEKTTVRYRLADTLLHERETLVFGRHTYEHDARTYDQPYFTFHRSSEMTSDEMLWWGRTMNAPVLYESSIEHFSVTGVTGQLQQVGNAYTETSVRLELVAVK